MTDIINATIAELYDRGLIADALVLEPDFIFLDLAIKGKIQTFLFDFTKQNKVTVFTRLGGWIPSTPSYIGQLAYIALETANGLLLDGAHPGRLTLDIRESDSALRFCYSASFPVAAPCQNADFICSATEAVSSVQEMVSRFCKHAVQGCHTIDDALGFFPEEDLDEENITIHYHPLIELLINKERREADEVDNN